MHLARPFQRQTEPRQSEAAAAGGAVLTATLDALGGHGPHGGEILGQADGGELLSRGVFRNRWHLLVN
jgi:hypothetical protein